MKVKDLIAKLKKMPQHLEIQPQAHDQSAHETTGPISRVELVTKQTFLDDPDDEIHNLPDWERKIFDDRPKQWVIIR